MLTGMILSDKIIEQLHDGLGIDPVPDNYPGLAKLIDMFGAQTFYLTAEGLHIWEYKDVAGEGNQVIVAVKIASWADEKKSDIVVHKPELTDVAVKLVAPDPTPESAKGSGR